MGSRAFIVDSSSGGRKLTVCPATAFARYTKIVKGFFGSEPMTAVWEGFKTAGSLATLYATDYSTTESSRFWRTLADSSG